MTRIRGINPKLQKILDKMKGKTEYMPVEYSPADKLAAKVVLDRLLESNKRREVSYIKIVPIEVQEE